ncbi:protein phosphatase CheZ [Roseibium litorale]|uniref:Protein phosphatase CheZ n=1 Tax=Roseibium litorale TaxID=2803841 RepID=A0ABR9CJG2_9HYPH|nr:protein phosphatase CheZ [Roseibium litorale]MBD8890456.1 protein phosphatase CheZ [Roseibium litorale]
MQPTDAHDELAPLADAEYVTLEQTLMESDRGRRFLSEFLKRNKTPETVQILDAIQRLEKTMTRQRKVPDLDRIRLDIADMHEAIERTKNEIANIKAEGGDTNRFTDASHELDAIITQTEGATQTILEAAEQIQEQAWTLREKGADEAVCDEIDAKATEIFMACSFQDLTGQRTNKVVQVLRYLESRINMMINIWGIEDKEADESAGPLDTRPDAHLLNGPQREGKGVNQENVDELLNSTFSASETVEADEPPAQNTHEASADDIDAIMAGTASDEELAQDASETLDAAAIDDMFSSPATPVVSEDEDFDAELPGDEDSEVLDEAAIDRLFESEAFETAADEAWESTEDPDNMEDPLEQLTPAERQALFN